MQYSIHKRRRLRIGRREQVAPAVTERTLASARQHREEHARAIAGPDPDHLVAPVPAEVAALPAEEPHVVDRRELVRIIHQSASFPVGLQRTITETRPIDHAEPAAAEHRRP